MTSPTAPDDAVDPHGRSSNRPPGDPVVVVDGLWKSFTGVSAVEDLSFAVQPGQVFGLLGPNGAGKTTTLRILMGLERPTRGSIRLFGTTVTPGCHELNRVGAMIEEAAFVPHLSGMRNLELWWRAGGAKMADADLEAALGIAGLGDAVHRKVKTYSQGMRQRLGLARLLLGRPELLVLDEPTNGLDPGEIREIREMIRRLTERGATVLLSSHHLTEIEQVCSHVLVMDHGRFVAQGTVSELIGSAGSVYIEVDDAEWAGTVLEGLESVANVRLQGEGLIVDQYDGGRRSDLTEALVRVGVRVETIMPTQRLEDAFLDLLASRELEPSQPVTTEVGA